MITDYKILLSKEYGLEYRTFIVRHSRSGWFLYDKNMQTIPKAGTDRDIVLPLSSLIGKSKVADMDDWLITYLFGCVVIPHLKANNNEFNIDNFKYTLISETRIYN